MEFDLSLPEDIAGPIATFWEHLNTRLSHHTEKVPDTHGKSSLLSFLGGAVTVESFLGSSLQSVKDGEKTYDLLFRLSQECLPKFLILYERFKFFSCAQSLSECAHQFLLRLKQQYKLCCLDELPEASLKHHIVSGVVDPTLRQCFENLSEKEVLDFLNNNTDLQYTVCDKIECDTRFSNELQSNVTLEKVLDNLACAGSVEKSLLVSKEYENKETNTEVWKPCRKRKSVGVESVRKTKKPRNKGNENIKNASKKKENSLQYEPFQASTSKAKNSYLSAQHIQRHRANLVAPKGFKKRYSYSSKEQDLLTTKTNPIRIVKAGMGTRGQVPISNITDNAKVVIRTKKAVTKNAKVFLPHPAKISEEDFALSNKKLLNKKKSTVANLEDDASRVRIKPGPKPRLPPVGEGILPCDMCHKFFKRDWFLRCHKILYHSTPDMVQCTLCPEGPFPTNTDLVSHVWFQHRKGQLRYKCTICEKAFSIRDQLREHHRTEHLGIKEFSCSTCPKKFSSAKVFQKHSEQCKINSEIFYPCTTCGLNFSNKNSLERHERTIHTMEKPFECEVCQSRFAMKCDLTAHMHTHEENRSRRYQCHICGKTFLKAYYLPRHMLQHQGVKNFQCQYCNDFFTTSYGLRKHCWRKHGQPRPIPESTPPLPEVQGASNASAEIDVNAASPPQPLPSSIAQPLETDLYLRPALQNHNLLVPSQEQIAQDLSSQNLSNKLYSVADTNSYAAIGNAQLYQGPIGPFTQFVPESSGVSTQETFSSHNTNCLPFTASHDLIASSMSALSRPFITNSSTQPSSSATYPFPLQAKLNFPGEHSVNIGQDVGGPSTFTISPHTQVHQQMIQTAHSTHRDFERTQSVVADLSKPSNRSAYNLPCSLNTVKGAPQPRAESMHRMGMSKPVENKFCNLQTTSAQAVQQHQEQQHQSLHSQLFFPSAAEGQNFMSNNAKCARSFH